MTDEPLGTHVLELQLADVIDETADARSLVFKVPDGPDGPVIPPETAAPRAWTVPHAARSQRSHRFGRALLLTVQLTVHRRRLDRHRQAHGRRLRVQLAVRQRPPGDAPARTRPVGHVRPQDARRRLPAAGCRQRHHPDDGDPQVRAVRGQRQGHAVLCQPRREVGDLRGRAARSRDRVPRPLHRRALGGIRAGTAERGGAGESVRAVRRARGVHLWTRPVHGGRRGSAGDRGRRAGAHPPRSVQVAGVRSVCCGRHRRGRR